MKRWAWVVAIALTVGGCTDPDSGYDSPSSGGDSSESDSGGDGVVSEAESDCVARITLDQMEGRRAVMTVDEMVAECEE